MARGFGYLIIINKIWFRRKLKLKKGRISNSENMKRSGWVIEKTVSKGSSGQWLQKHTTFAPARQKLFGFRLRSPLRRRGTVPAQPSNGFFIHWPSQNKNICLARAKLACFRNTQPDQVLCLLEKEMLASRNFFL